MSFHEIRFPLSIALGATGGPERRTEVVTLASGGEVRNSLWANSRRRYNAGYGLRSLDDIALVRDFFEGRRGRLFGFRWRDRTDWTSAAPSASPAAGDQLQAKGDGVRLEFPLYKAYEPQGHPWFRRITKPVAGSVRMSVGGVEVSSGAYRVDTARGVVIFFPGHVPAAGADVRAGFEFDTPVRFDTDVLDISLTSFEAGEIPSIPIVEILLP